MKEVCLICGNSVSMASLKEHIELCTTMKG